jgi:CheY-like chemotaxis protein
MVACKILIIDDDIDDIVILHEAFDKKGLATDLFFIQNPEATLAHLESLSDYELPHLIISDLNMPKLDGFELLKLLKQHDRFCPIPVILFSTSTSPFHKEKALQLGAHSFITKPLNMAGFIKFAESVVGVAEVVAQCKG